MRIFGIVSYNGKNYQGWQIQPDAPSVEEEIEKHLSKYFNKKIVIYGAGRTDAGVHALGQTFHFDIDIESIDLDKLLYSLNKMLPPDIKINDLDQVEEDFHARFSAKSKHYSYSIVLDSKNVFFYDTMYVCPFKIDLKKLKECLTYFVGKHDFKNVTLVGVVLADIGLNIPSFRASERTFSLLTQAIGRAGRSTKIGKAIIQTYSKDNYVIQKAASQDYNAFFNEEMGLRKMGQYPPYTYCAILTFASSQEKDVIDASTRFKNFLEAKFASKRVDVIGPSEPFMVKLNDKYRRKILLKYKSYEDIHDVLEEVIQNVNKNSKIDVVINIDPYEDY